MRDSPDVDMDVHSPSLLELDAFCLVHISQFLTRRRDLASLQSSCKTLFHLLQESSAWAKVLKLYYGGIQLQLASPTVEASSSTAPKLPNYALCRLLENSADDLYPIRFVAVYTDGGVDAGALHYWADHAFIPNSWAPFCAKYSDNVNLLAILKTGPEATSELTHRQMMIDCLKWALPLLQQNPVPADPEKSRLDPAEVNEAAEMLTAWKTQRLESFFCQMAARAAAGDPLGLFMMRGLPAESETRLTAQEGRPVDPTQALTERRKAAAVLGRDISTRTWYNRAYRLQFVQPQLQHQQQVAPLRPMPDAGAGAAPGPMHWRPARRPAAGGDRRWGAGAPRDSPYVLDEMAVRSELMTPEIASSVAIVHGLAVSREGRLSCPVQSGALLAGLLPTRWPSSVLAASAAGCDGKDRAASPSSSSVAASAGGADKSEPPVSAYEAAMRAVVEQPAAWALNDKQDAESVFAACASGQLPPWVRHVVMEHAEYIELLPPHLEAGLAPGKEAANEAAGAGAAEVAAGPAGTGAGASADTAASAAGTSGGGGGAPRQRPRPPAGIPELHPVVWFRFTDHAEYSRRRLSSRARTLLRHVSELCGTAMELLAECTDLRLDALRDEVAAWAGPAAAGACDGASGAAAATPAPPAAPLPCRSPRPAALGTALHCATRVADQLTSLGTAAAMLAPELRAAAGYTLPENELHALLEAATRLKSALLQVGARLAELEQLTGALQARQAAALRSAKGARRAAEVEEDEEKEESGDEEVEKEALEGMEGGGGGVGAVAAAAQGGGGVRAAKEEQQSMWLKMEAQSLRIGVQRLWRMLQGEALGAEGRRARLELAAALRRQRDDAAAAAVAQAAGPDVVERRNEELLKRLPVPPPPTPPGGSSGGDKAAAAAIVEAAAEAASAAVAPAPGARAAPALEAAPPAGWAAERLFDPRLQQEVDAGRVVLPEADGDGHRVVHLAARLMFPVAANAVVFKAIRPENLMAMVGWDESEAPNVDVQYVALQGRVVKMPPGVQVVPPPPLHQQ